MRTKAKPSESQRPDVFAFHDYRKYLQAMFKYQNETLGVSLRAFAKETGIGASFLSLVLSGKRTPSLPTLQKIGLQFKLNKTERRALELMFNIAESMIEEVRHESLVELQSLAPYKEKNHLEMEAYKYLSKWYFVAVRELVGVDNFKEDPAWIREALSKTITESQAKEALEFLESRGLIHRKSGKLVKTTKTLTCDEGIYKMSLGSFYTQIYDLASKSIDLVPRSHRHLASHTFAFNSTRFEQIRDLLEDSLNRVEELENSSSDNDSVYHVGLMAIPLTKPNPKSGGLNENP